MSRDAIFQRLRDFIVSELLSGDGDDLTGQTPLLELGVLDSLSVVKLASFIESQLGARVPPRDMNPANLGNLDSIADLVAAQPRE